MDTEVKSKSKTWIVLLVFIVLAVGFIYFQGQQKTHVPSELVLETTTESSYDEKVKIGFNQFESDKSLAELVESYRKILIDTGWKIEVDKGTKDIGHRFFGSKGKYKVNVFISAVGTASGEASTDKRVVQVHYLYAWPSIEYNQNDQSIQ